MRRRPDTAQPGATRVGSLLVEWALLLVLWFLFAGSINGGELLVGTVAAAIGLGLSRAARATRLAAFRPHPRWLLVAWRLPLLVAHDAALLVVGLGRRLLGRPVNGRVHEVPLDVAGRDPSSATYRALVTAFTSMPPNAYVIDIDVERRVAILHRLVSTGRRPELVLPGWGR